MLFKVFSLTSFNTLDSAIYRFFIPLRTSRLNWINIDFINSIPSCDFEFIQDYDDLFEKKTVGTLYSRILNQISMIFNKFGSDGGLFIVIGKKKN